MVTISILQKMLSNQQSTHFSNLSLDKKCPVARPKCGRTSSNSCQANEALDLRALALDRAAVQAEVEIIILLLLIA